MNNLNPESCTERPKQYEIYLYGTLAVLLVSALSLIGALILPGIRGRAYHYVMTFFMSLAVGTLMADAFLHLIPEALGVHGDSHGIFCDEIGNGTLRNSIEIHDDLEEENGRLPLWRMTAALASLFSFYVFETVTHFIADLIKKRHVKPMELNAFQMSGTTSPINQSDFIVVPVNGSPRIKNFRQDLPGNQLSHLENGSILHGNSNQISSHSHSHSNSHAHHHLHHHHHHADDYGENQICGVKPVAIMMLLSSSIHSFTDGIAIGSTFSAGIVSGLSTTIAVICHEVPHEIGNFAVLLQAGMKVKWALLMNLLSASSAVVGLFIGIALASVENFEQWLFAIVAGQFIYIALVDLIHEIRVLDANLSALRYCAAFLGVIIGIGILLALAFFEPYMHLKT